MDAIKPHPQANEVLLKENGAWLYFTNPHRIIQSDSLAEILPSLREIEDLIRINNWHAAGFLSYESAPAFDLAHRASTTLLDERSSLRSARDNFPLLWFGLYPAPRLLSDLPPFDQTQGKPASTTPALTWLPTTDRATYNAAIAQIKSHIADGRTYQVNYTLRLHSGFNIDPWDFFLHLAQTQNNHAAYIDTGQYVIASASPELFFQLDGETITCRPMKGTTPRGRTTREDHEQAQWLHESEKNRAENVMIVDMIRNDLGRIATIGSVQVPHLFTVEKYPTLWQMTSTVQAKTSASLTQIFTALFPCASITGAPKVSTMRIISELETSPRKLYTGSIGHIAPNRKATFNVAIRTALIDRATQTAEYGVGGGIVWDSTSADEYAEALLKSRVLTERAPEFSLLETMLWTPADGIHLRAKHLARILDSAEYFDFPISREQLEHELTQLTYNFSVPQRLRLLIDRKGNITTEYKLFELSHSSGKMKAHLAKEPIDSSNVFLYHKTTHRAVYDSAHTSFPEYDDVLLYNERGELTEFTIGNLVVEMDGVLYTPPISCGLLPGTFRAQLIETSQVEERVIQMAELEKCSKIFLVNSVRMWQQIESFGDASLSLNHAG